MDDYRITDYGAKGGGKENEARAIQAAIDACYAAGGGRVVVPAGGEFASGTFYLKDNVELHVERGARLIASRRREDFHTHGKWSPMISAIDASNIALSGGGEINGRGPFFMGEKLPHIYRKKGWRPHPVVFYDCKRVIVRDIWIRQSASWTLTLEGCEDVAISGISIENTDLIPNDDGIDLCSCRNVRVSDCQVKCGDDAIVMKTMPNWRDRPVKPCENVTIANCTLESQSFALNIGCEARAPMRNMVFSNIVIANSHRGAGIHLSHGCDIEDILFSDMVIETRLFHPDWWGRGEPIYVVAIPWTPDEKIGAIRRARFRNILCRSENGVVVYGWDADRIQDLVLDGVSVEIDSWSGMEGGQLDLRPYPGEATTDNILVDKATDGFYLKNATGVELRGCRAKWKGERKPWHGQAMASEGVVGLKGEVETA